MNEPFYELRNGKPYLGEWLGTYLVISNFSSEVLLIGKDMLERHLTALYIDNGFEIKEKQFIERKPQTGSFLEVKGSLAVKYCLFGRAFKIKRLLCKGIKRYKKVRVNGKYKQRRLDKRKDASMLQNIC